MASYSILFLIFSLFFISSFPSSSYSKATYISISLSKFKENPSPDPWNKKLSDLALASLTRAHYLKTPKSESLSKIPVFPRSYGGYSIFLSFGTPPQTFPMMMDTGSSLVWIPCTNHYACKNCSSNGAPTKKSSFISKLSSTTKPVSCKNPICNSVFGNVLKNCSQLCPSYNQSYAKGSTSGELLSETLIFPQKNVSNFIFGCSSISSEQPASIGYAGFGRGMASLPSQLNLKKFTYCLLSHQLDDTSKSSSLVLKSGSDSGDTKSNGFDYTPFVKNPFFPEFYYVVLTEITVGEKSIIIPQRYMVPGSDGDGGTIIDSGTTITIMEGRLFELVATEFIKQMPYKRLSAETETQIGFWPCFHVPDNVTVVVAPELNFHFKGGVKMVLPLENYLSNFGILSDVLCLSVQANGADGINISSGPSIILGNDQQQNFCMEFDLENERLGVHYRTKQ